MILPIDSDDGVVKKDGLPVDFSPEREFRGRVWVAMLIVTAVAAIVYVLWRATNVALVFFASILVGIFFEMATRVVAHLTHWKRRWAFAAAVGGFFCVASLGGYLLAAPISAQCNFVADQLPKVIQHDKDVLNGYSWGRTLLSYLQNSNGILTQAGGIVQKLPALFSISLQGLVDGLVILFAGFYLALNPDLYLNGFLHLFPVKNRAKGQWVLHELGWGLRHWLMGQMVCMMVMGLLTWVGLMVLGVPASGVLAILSGLLDFVPVVGTLFVASLSCGFAMLKSPAIALDVGCLFLGLHLFEQQVIIPLVQRHATHLPPVLTIFSMILFYELFGLGGLILATPLLTVVLVAMRTLYVEPVIDRKTEKLPAEEPSLARS